MKLLGDRSPNDCWSALRGRCGRAYACFYALFEVGKGFVGQPFRPDIEGIVSSGCFTLAIDVIAAFGASFDGDLQDVSYMGVYSALQLIMNCRAHPFCQESIRGIAKALRVCVDNSMPTIPSIGFTADGVAVQIAAAVFGRDEDGEFFSFTQGHVDGLIDRFSGILKGGEGILGTYIPTADNMIVLELCVSDKNKPLLLANQSFIPYLIEGLLLDPAHPRAGLADEQKVWLQSMHTECIAQVALFPMGREALLQHPSVCAIESLQAVVDRGTSDEARVFAQSALSALLQTPNAAGSDSPRTPRWDAAEGGEELHVMLSYQWNSQTVMIRLNESL